MPTTLKAARGDLAFQAEFAEPTFEIFRDSWPFYRRLHSSLAQFGLRLGDIRPERGAGSLGDLHVALTLFNATTTVRIRADKVEINCADTARVDGKSLENAAVQILQTIKNHATTLQYRNYSIGIAVHGTVSGMDTKLFLAQFVKATSLDLGPHLATGGVIYHGPEGNRLLSAVTLDLSAVVTGGLFLRAYAVWNALGLEAADFPVAANRYWEDVLTKLGLTLETS
jgi:hypothetical protein